MRALDVEHRILFYNAFAPIASSAGEGPELRSFPYARAASDVTPKRRSSRSLKNSMLGVELPSGPQTSRSGDLRGFRRARGLAGAAANPIATNYVFGEAFYAIDESWHCITLLPGGFCMRAAF